MLTDEQLVEMREAFHAWAPRVPNGELVVRGYTRTALGYKLTQWEVGWPDDNGDINEVLCGEIYEESDAKLIRDMIESHPVLLAEVERLKGRLIAMHAASWSGCTAENCAFDGGDEHAQAFAQRLTRTADAAKP